MQLFERKRRKRLYSRVSLSCCLFLVGFVGIFFCAQKQALAGCTPFILPTMPPAPPGIPSITTMPMPSADPNQSFQAPPMPTAPPGIPTSAPLPMPTGGPTPSGSPVPSKNCGNLDVRIYQSAVRFRGQPTTWPGTSCHDGKKGDGPGNCACAAAVQHVVYLATGIIIGNYNTSSWVDMAFTGLYESSVISARAALPGDIIIWSKSIDSYDHMGFCASPQCTETFANSSDYRTFAPYIADIYDNGYFRYYLIFRLGRIGQYAN